MLFKIYLSPLDDDQAVGDFYLWYNTFFFIILRLRPKENKYHLNLLPWGENIKHASCIYQNIVITPWEGIFWGRKKKAKSKGRFTGYPGCILRTVRRRRKKKGEEIPWQLDKYMCYPGRIIAYVKKNFFSISCCNFYIFF